MTIQLDDIQPTQQIIPPRIVLYGPEKIGKTTFASEIEGALYFDFEVGSGRVNVRRARPEWKSSYGAVLETVRTLRSQEHNYSAAVFDTADWLEMIIHKQVATENGKRHIEDIGYGAGYKLAGGLWKTLLDELTLLAESGLPVILLAHNQIKRYDNPLTDSYDQHRLKLHDISSALVKEWCDCLLFADQTVYVDKKDVGFKKTVTKGRAGDIVLHTVASPAFAAGNRYGLPSELPFTWAAFIEAFNASVIESQPATAA